MDVKSSFVKPSSVSHKPAIPKKKKTYKIQINLLAQNPDRRNANEVSKKKLDMRRKKKNLFFRPMYCTRTNRGGFTTRSGGLKPLLPWLIPWSPLEISANERGISAMEQEKEVLEAQRG
jgi:hypothetical protein